MLRCPSGRPHARGAQRRDENRCMFGRACRPHRQGYGETWFPHIFTSAVHAAAPHNDEMNMGFSWEGAALPHPPRWRVVSREGCALPHPPRWRVVSREGCALPHPPRWRVVSREGCALLHPPRWRVVSWEGCALPHPPLREGVGKTRFPHFPTALRGGWRHHRQGCGSTGSPQVGKPGFPVCSPQGRGETRASPAGAAPTPLRAADRGNPGE